MNCSLPLDPMILRAASSTLIGVAELRVIALCGWVPVSLNLILNLNIILGVLLHLLNVFNHLSLLLL